MSLNSMNAAAFFDSVLKSETEQELMAFVFYASWSELSSETIQGKSFDQTSL